MPVAMLLMLNCNLMAQNSQSRALWCSICNNKNISNKADYQQHSKKVLLSWRMLPSDDATTAFDLYRKAGADGTEEKIASGITGSTCYQDLTIDKTKDNTYRLTFADSNETLDTYTMTAEFATAGQPYVTIPLKSTEDITTDPHTDTAPTTAPWAIWTVTGRWK